MNVHTLIANTEGFDRYRFRCGERKLAEVDSAFTKTDPFFNSWNPPMLTLLEIGREGPSDYPCPSPFVAAFSERAMEILRPLVERGTEITETSGPAGRVFESSWCT